MRKLTWFYEPTASGYRVCTKELFGGDRDMGKVIRILVHTEEEAKAAIRGAQYVEELYNNGK